MAVLRYVTHPQVRVSADVPVQRWGLSDIGRARAGTMLSQPWVAAATRLLSSDETKALETAAIIATATGLALEVRSGLHENDRSSTGFVPPDRFEELADAFFAEPEMSVEGWETAADAQRRVVAATADLFEARASDDGDVLISGHGAVGTLLMCSLLDLSISREHDQNGPTAAPGGGNYWTFDLGAGRMLHRWRPIDEIVS